VIAGHDHAPAELVPTHGDWQPRNWLIHHGVVRVIDLGRADWRPALTDLARLARQEWQGRPDLEAAFLAGYGSDPRDDAAWQRTLVREAIGTAVWAHQVGDAPFEAQGHRMIAAALRSG
jgi:thiamine kinase-like enzyme